MQYPAWARAAVVACGVTILSPDIGRGQDQPQAPANDTATCTGDIANADASIAACTRLFDQETRESARRRASALTFRAMAWREKGDTRRAITDLTEAIALDENFEAAYELRGDLLRENDQCDLAIPEYSRVIQLNPQRTLGYISRAICLSDRNENERALADLDQAIKLDANKADGQAVLALSIKARLAAIRNDPVAAIAALDDAIRLDPHRAPLFVDRGTILLGRGNQDKGLADYDEAIKLDAGNAAGVAVSVRALKARFYLGQKNLDAALAEYDEAIKLDPKRLLLYVDRAGIWDLKGDPERALAEFEQALKTGGDEALIYNSRGDFHRNKGDFPRAVADYDQAIGKLPNDPSAYGNRGLVRFYQGEFARAVDDFKRAVSAEQASPYSVLLLYISRTRSGSKDAGPELTKSAAKIDKSRWPYPLVELFLGRKQPQATEAAATNAEERCEAQFYLGQWHLVRNARPAAFKALQAAAETCPKDFVEYRGAIEELKRLRP